MTKPELIDYIANRFSADPEYPWEDDQTDCVFRHGNNKKWFALYMEVERKRLGLEGSGAASILNVKTGPLLQQIGSASFWTPLIRKRLKNCWTSVGNSQNNLTGSMT